MNTQSPTTGSGPDSEMANVIERNIHALVVRRRIEEENRRLQDRVADRVTAFAGSMLFVYLHLFIFGLWIIINLGWLPFLPRFDPSLVVPAMIASVEAIFLSTFVLITQNRMARKADQRADLDLQISLLAEHEVTHLLTLVTAIARRMDIEESKNPELSELARNIAPEKVLDKIEEKQERENLPLSR